MNTLSSSDNGQPISVTPDLEAVLQALQSDDEHAVASTALYYGLSASTADSLERIKPVWETLSPDRRKKIVQALAEASETDFELDYHTFGLFNLDDSEPEVRKTALDMLWIDESIELMDRLIDLAQWDESLQVRTEAVKVLGRFIYLGEMEDLPQIEVARAQNTVISLYHDMDQDVEIRRRALEAISNSSHEIVEEAILESYADSDQQMKTSAIYAMGRSCDQQWEDWILRELDADDPALLYEAVQAAGELGLASAVPQLTRLSQESDREIQEGVVWSLGEIGGNEALRVLSTLADQWAEGEDDDMLEAIEDAIGNASLSMDVSTLLDFDLGLDD